VNKQAAQILVEDVDKAVEKATRNPTCLYPGCSNSPIGSHIIARKTLKLIAENNHVLTWLTPSTWDMVHAHDAGKPLEQLNQNPVYVGISDKRKVTNPLFCENHDGKIFIPLEQQEFSFQPEQVLLLAYRASCCLTFPNSSPTEAILEVARKHGYAHSLDTPERRQKLERFQAVKSVLAAQKRYTQMYQSKDYSQLAWSIYPVNVPLCIAATYSLIPVNDNDALAIVNGTLPLAAEDVVSFSFLPYPPLNNSICVISWLKGSQRAQQFMSLNRINELPEKEQQDLFFSFAFESPNIYISPLWWKVLSQAKREEYKQAHLQAGREHAELV
jgi:hypothetical protein